MANVTGYHVPNFKPGQSLTAKDLQKILAGHSPYVQGTAGNLVSKVGDQLRIQAPRKRGRGPPSAASGVIVLDVVQAIEAAGTGAAAGTIGVKTIVLKSNLTASPNFEQTGNRRVVSYYSL